ncbi:MAG TPA: exodeoxyribonuclease V subunit gamma [Fibrobacteria bacterium]|nr:exodeoxyribonuclease V subunit gamma [Fibrobacteria bacterium]
MPLHLHLGNRPELLADALARTLGRTWTDPFDPPQIVVPSPSVGKWFKLHLAARGRTVLNLPTSTLESFLWKTLDPGPDDRILRVDALQHAVARLLEPELLALPEYAMLRRFLTDGGEGIDPGRRVQLSREVARLFLEYEYNRPSVLADGKWAIEGIDRTWPDRPFFALRGPESDAERWQRHLHGLVFAPEGPLSGSGFLGLPRLHRLRREQGRDLSGPDVHLLFVDKSSHFHRNMLLELARSRGIHLYLVNPCMEFWEDLDTSRRRPRTKVSRIPLRRLESLEFRAESLPSDLYSGKDPALLREWGKTSRENIALWCQAVDHDFQDHVRDPMEAGVTLLSTVQSALLRRLPGPLHPGWGSDGSEGEPCADDGSLRILSCPESLREMEAARDAVYQWLSEDPERRPSDAVVYLPDTRTHAAALEAVFDCRPRNDPGRIGISVLGTMASNCLWARGAKALLSIATNGLDRSVVLSLSENPLVRARRNLSELDVLPWAHWMEGTGSLAGWDAKDRRLRGAAEGAAVEAHTLRAGLERLALGSLATDAVDTGSPPGWGDGGLPPWRDRESTDSQALEPFLSFLEDLHRDTRELSLAGPRDLHRMGCAFADLCDAWLDTSSDPQEDSLRRAFMESLDNFRLRGPGPVDLPELSESLRGILESELPGSSKAWSGTLTIAPLRASHILPHGLVVIAGLDAESFPGEARSGSLDLLSSHRILGDADAVAENRHAFLLALLSARDRLVLSWRARDLQKDSLRSPSPVLLELESALADGFLGATATSTPLRRAVPLLARSGGALPGDPAVWSVPSWDPEDLPKPAAGPAASPGTALSPLRYAQLRSFLKNPYLLAARPGWRFDESDREEVERPLESDGLEKLARWRSLTEYVLSAPDFRPDPAQAVRRILTGRSWNSGSPEGEFLDREAADLRTWVVEISRGLESTLGDGGRFLRDRPLGFLEGTRRWSWESEVGAPITLLDLVPFAGAKVRPDAKAELYLAGAAMRAGGSTSEIRLVWVERGGEGRVLEEPLPDGADAEWIRDLVLDARDPDRVEFLPIREALAKGATRELLEEALESSNRHVDFLERLLEPRLPDLSPEAFDALMARRFRPWRENVDA